MTNSETKKKVEEKLEVISVEDYYKMKPKTFEPNHVLKFLSFLYSGRLLPSIAVISSSL